MCEPDVELITQHSLSSDKQPTLDQDGVKRQKTTTGEVSKNEAQPNRPVGEYHVVVRVDKCTRKGNLVKFQTVWLDGGVTEEYRDYLEKNWPNILKAFDRSRRAENQARYSFRKLARTQTAKPTEKPSISLSDSHFYGTPFHASPGQIKHNMQRPYDPSISVVRIEQGIPRYSG